MKYAEDLKAFVDGELSLAQMVAIRTAMESDPELRQEVETMKLLGDAVREEAQEPAVKPEGARTVIEKLPPDRRFFSFPRVHPMVWTGVAVLLFAIAVVGLKPSTQSDDVASAPGSASATVATSSPMAKSVASYAKAAPPMMGGAKSTSGALDVNGTVMSKTRHRAPQNTTRSMAEANPAPAPDSTKNLLTAPTNRKVIQNGSLEIAADNVTSAQANAIMIAKSVGGYAESSNLDFSDQSSASASMTLRVPAMTFDDVMTRLERLGTVKSDSVTGQDVTADYADTDARLRELGAEEDSYVTMLRGARSIGQILEIKDRLSSVRQDIQSYQEQLSALKDQSMLSTITMTLDQKPKVGPKVPQNTTPDTWASDTWATAANGLSAAARFLAQCGIFLFVYLPIWLPIMLAVWYLNRRKK